MNDCKPRLIFEDGAFLYELPDGRRIFAAMGGDNNLITPDIVARLAYANLYATTVMAQLVYRDFEQDFRGAVGDTITIRKPATFVANEFDRATGIEIQDAVEGSTTVQLDTLLDVSFAVTAEQLTLQVADFNEQLVVPAVEAIRQGMDAKLMTLAADVTQAVGPRAGDVGGSDPKLLIDARVQLNQNKVPMTDRYAVLGPETAGEWLKDPLFVNADQRGDTDGLREASIGRKFGFDSYETQNVPVVTGAENSLAFHRSAFALVARTLALPKGSQNAAVFGDQGFGLRVVQDYDIDKKQDVMSIDLLIGAKTLDADRAVVIVGP